MMKIARYDHFAGLMKYYFKLMLIIIFLLGNAMIAASQNAPVTTCATVSDAIGGTVSVPITVTGFTNIGAVSLTLDYDYAVAHFIQGTPNPAMSNFLSGDYDLGNGFHRISMGWYGSSNTLADGSTIMTLYFNYIGGNSPLNWYENGASCEYADPLGNVLNDVPAENFYINGYLCGAIGNPGTIEGNDFVCQGQTGELYSVASLPNVAGYTWTVPDGALIINGQNTNSITVDYSETAVPGNIAVYAFNPCGNGPASQLPVTVNELPIADAGNDTTINYGTSTTLHAAAGGSGTFSYHWSPEEMLIDPDTQYPQTVILTTTILFTLTVTNEASSCQSHDEVTLTITGGTLSVNPIAIPGAICNGEYAQLYSNAGGGSGNYNYQWTCIPPDDPPWSSTDANPLVSPSSSKQYILFVNDGFTDVSGAVAVPVLQLPTATISGGDSLCGQGNFTTLPVDLTGAPPWSFIYTNGITSVIVNDQYITPYDIITGDPGTYTIVDLQDANCNGPSYGSATVYVFPVPATPEITVIDFNLISSVCCGNQWYLDNEAIPGATGQVFAVTESGWYYDIVTLNGCSSDASESVDMIVGINEIKDMKATLAPNPADDFVKINFPGPLKGNMTITVSSADGRVAGKYEFRSIEKTNQFSIDISCFAAGLYFVAISTSDKSTVCKLIVN
jgi:hypothetical protein